MTRDEAHPNMDVTLDGSVTYKLLMVEGDLATVEGSTPAIPDRIAQVFRVPLDRLHPVGVPITKEQIMAQKAQPQREGMLISPSDQVRLEAQIIAGEKAAVMAESLRQDVTELAKENADLKAKLAALTTDAAAPEPEPERLVGQDRPSLETPPAEPAHHKKGHRK